MKQVIFNKYNLSKSDTQIVENRVKLLIRNSLDELLLCKINGVYHFVGGRIEKGETVTQCAKREALEETGIRLDANTFIPFLQLKQFEKNYYNTGKNCLSTITFIESMTDEKFNYDGRHLDNEESKKDFRLTYIPINNIMTELENNRETAKKDGREFIINEMQYVISEYKNELLNKKRPQEGLDVER